MAFLMLHQGKLILPDQFLRGDEITIHPPSSQGSEEHQAEGSLWGSLWRQRARGGESREQMVVSGNDQKADGSLTPNWGLCSWTTTSGPFPADGK